MTIVPRDDGTLGFVQPLPDERVHLTRQDYEEQLEVFVAGRAAEELRYGKDGVVEWREQRPAGGNDARDPDGDPARPAGSGKLMLVRHDVAAERAMAEAAIRSAYQRALKKLKSHRKQLDRLALALVDRQELTGEEARAILSR